DRHHILTRAKFRLRIRPWSSLRYVLDLNPWALIAVINCKPWMGGLDGIVATGARPDFRVRRLEFAHYHVQQNCHLASVSNRIQERLVPVSNLCPIATMEEL